MARASSEQSFVGTAPEQHAAFCRKLRGRDAYYGITCNAHALTRLRFAVARQWCKWLNTQSPVPSVAKA